MGITRGYRKRSWSWKAGAVATTVAVAVGLVPPSPAHAAGTTAEGTVQYMQVVAHPDDDLFFMNPDVHKAIQGGFASVTVYTTASEISGNGSTPAQRAKSLQRGVMDAYARMAGVPDTNPNAQEEWSGSAWTIGTRKLERFSLVARPNVQLVFMGLHDTRLDEVYAGTLTDTTVVPSPSPIVSTQYSYNKAQFTSTLNSIITSYQPSILRYQDPLVDSRYFPDHTDHMATVDFVRDALATYTGTVTEMAYRDYNISDTVPNLSSSEVTTKTQIFNVYKPYDGAADPANWLERMYPRWPRGTKWAALNGSGQPQAFVVRKGVVQTVAQNSDGTWAAPVSLTGAGGRVVTSLSVVKNNDNTLQVFARRETDAHIITIKQTAAGGSWPASWADLGNPNIQFGGEVEQVGAPTAVVNANGSLWVFVKDGGGGVCGKRQTVANGSWGNWLDLGGGDDIQEGMAAIKASDGRVSLFASTRDNVRTWRQSAANGDLVEQGNLPVGPGYSPAGPPSVTMNHDNTLEVIYRDAGSDATITTWQTSVGGSWTTSPAQFGGQGGVGQASVITAPPGADARIMVFERNANTGVSLAMQTAPDASYGSWSDLGGTILDSPSTIVDSSGAVVIFVVGADGKVYVKRQASAGAGVPFSAWQQAG